MIEFAAAVAVAVARPRSAGSSPPRTGESPRPTVEVLPRSVGTTTAKSEADSFTEGELAPPRGVGLRWVALVLLAAVVVVVFLATR
jgi:hypothetical protein